MSGENKEYFHIDLTLLAGRKIFPFHIYVYNPMTSEYTPFLWGNQPLTNDKFQLIQFIIEKGGGIAISIKQKKTFLLALDLKEDEVPGLRKKEKGSLQKSQEEMKEAIKKENEENGPYKFKEEFKKSIEEDDFSHMIARARNEILTFAVTTSHTVSLARFLADELLYDDNQVNRIVAVTYMLAKTIDVKEEEALGDLVCASFFHHLGYTQIDNDILHRTQLTLHDEDKKKLRQHSGLSQHLLNKSGVDLSPRCINIILEHHERSDGSGYPNGKTEQHLDPLAMTLGAVSHMFEFTSGKVTGTPVPMKSFIHNLKEMTLQPGMEYKFGDLVYQNLIHLMKLEEVEAKERMPSAA